MHDGNGLADETAGVRLSLQDLCIVVACNDRDKLDQHIGSSELVERYGVPVHVECGAASAASAYNRGLDATTEPIVIFAHQDVYFPPGWHSRLVAILEELSAADPDWALAAPFGMAETDGAYSGNVWSSSLGGIIGASISRPVLAQSFDELTIIMRRDAGLRFDEALPGWHLYGTDIVQTARSAGRGAYVVPLPLVHNDNYHDQLRADFVEGYRFIRRKWRERLPIRTPVLWVTRHGLSLPAYQFRAWRSDLKRRDLAADTLTDPKVYSARCGWE